MVKEHSLESTVKELNHAILEGPAASLASNVTGLPPTDIPLEESHVKSGFDTKSGMTFTMEVTLAD